MAKPTTTAPTTTRPTAARTNPADPSGGTSPSSRNPGRPAPTEEAIRTRAYSLWEQAGRPACDGVQFWLEAEKELSNPR